MSKTNNLKHLKTFENYSINEELFGIDIMGKIRNWVNSKPEIKEDLAKFNDFLKKNPKELQSVKSEFEKMDPKSKQKLGSFVQQMDSSDVKEIENEVKESLILRKFEGMESSTFGKVIKKVVAVISTLSGGVTIAYGFINAFMNLTEVFAKYMGTGASNIWENYDKGGLIAIGVGMLLAVIGYLMGTFQDKNK